jgi:hypothetical protein
MYELKSFVLIIFFKPQRNGEFLSLSLSLSLKKKMAQFDIGAYLTKEFYDKGRNGEDNSYVFSNNRDVKYRLATLDSNSISFKVLVAGNFKLSAAKRPGSTKKVASKKSKQVVNNETMQCKEDPAPQVEFGSTTE